ncbi:MAG: hypothetical protein C0619_10595 [Desulfuromonas sp.]|nr:MAG: hypothetical protein C0619_10595 [Desulfuromonas sp.]
MFVQQQNLSFLNLPATRLRRLFSSTVDEQVALPDYPAQMASVYLIGLASNNGIQVLLAFYLRDSRRSVFFVPPGGDVAFDQAEAVLQEGLEFAESMGFILADADIHQYNPEQLDSFWRGLPICRRYVTPEPHPVAKPETPCVAAKATIEPPAEVRKEPSTEVRKEAPAEVRKEAPAEVRKEAPAEMAKEVRIPPVVDLKERRKRCRESLGRFLASL